MYHGIWGQSLLIDKDSRVDIRMTDYDKISKLVPKERVQDTQTSLWLKDEFSYFKLSLNVSSKKIGFFPTNSDLLPHSSHWISYGSIASTTSGIFQSLSSHKGS